MVACINLVRHQKQSLNSTAKLLLELGFGVNKDAVKNVRNKMFNYKLRLLFENLSSIVADGSYSPLFDFALNFGFELAFAAMITSVPDTARRNSSDLRSGKRPH